MRRSAQALPLLLSVILILLTLCTALLATTHTHSIDCFDHVDCTACVFIRAVGTLLRLMALLFAGILCLLALAVSHPRPTRHLNWPPALRTPIALKVRMNP